MKNKHMFTLLSMLGISNMSTRSEIGRAVKMTRKSILYPSTKKIHKNPKFGNIPKFTTKSVFNYRKWLKSLGRQKKKSNFRVIK